MTAATELRNDLLMDRIYRHQRHIYDLTRKYYLLGRDRLIGDLEAGADDMILEIGCGTGRNLIKTAKRYPEARCFGLDISREMLATAKRSIRRNELDGRIYLFRGDAANFDGATMVGQPTFDRILISYSLSMIPSWRMTLERAIRALAPGRPAAPDRLRRSLRLAVLDSTRSLPLAGGVPRLAARRPRRRCGQARQSARLFDHFEPALSRLCQLHHHRTSEPAPRNMKRSRS